MSLVRYLPPQRIYEHLFQQVSMVDTQLLELSREAKLFASRTSRTEAEKYHALELLLSINRLQERKNTLLSFQEAITVPHSSS